jgi:RNA-splicing ligase RtcB
MKVKGKYGTAILYATQINDNVIEQIEELMNQRFIEKSNVRIMPDCHQGVGCVIGTTMNIKDSVVPNLVGVDIGCGMLTINLGKLNINLPKLDEFIHKNIPAGEKIYDTAQEYDVNITEMVCYDKLKHKKRFDCSIGTLGGGNHFIEIDKDEDDNLYLIIHTGSRNLGTQVCEYYMKVAKNKLLHRQNLAIKEIVESLKKKGKENKIESEIAKIKDKYKLINKNLLPLYDNDFVNYLYDMNICQEYARENRERIAKKIIEYLGFKISDFEYFHTVHNYINMNDMILRKGAISAYKGEKVLIPINMRDGSIIAIGKSNGKYNFSAPHGAGRLLSRSRAKEKISLEEFKKSMNGIYSTSVCKNTLDESPFAYKSIDDIIPIFYLL